MKMLSLWGLVCLTLLPGPLLAQAASATPVLPSAVLLETASAQRIDTLVRREMQSAGIPGLQIAVVKDGHLVYANGYRFADISAQAPVTNDTVFPWASISKTATAIAVMQLVKAGKIDLDAPIQKYVPSFPVKPFPITARELLGHLGGVRHYQGQEVFNTRHYASVTDGLAIFQNDSLVAKPGMAFHYSSYGFNLLGAAIEGASGLRYTDYVRRFVFAPAGVLDIGMDDSLRPSLGETQKYGRFGGVLRPAPLTDNSYKLPSGGWCSSATALAQWAAAVMAGRVIDQATLAQMWTEQRTRDGKPTGYGLGWELPQGTGRSAVGHSGGQPGISTMLYMQPEQNRAVVVFCNLNAVNLRPLAAQVLNDGLGHSAQ